MRVTSVHAEIADMYELYLMKEKKRPLVVLGSVKISVSFKALMVIQPCCISREVTRHL